MDRKYMKGESAMALQARGLAAKQDDPSSNPRTCAGKKKSIPEELPTELLTCTPWHAHAHTHTYRPYTYTQ